MSLKRETVNESDPGILQDLKKERGVTTFPAIDPGTGRKTHQIIAPKTALNKAWESHLERHGLRMRTSS